jgi:hypothetical protein
MAYRQETGFMRVPFPSSQTPRRFSEFLRELEQRREQAKAERQALHKGSPEEEDLEPDPLPKPQRTVRQARSKQRKVLGACCGGEEVVISVVKVAQMQLDFINGW